VKRFAPSSRAYHQGHPWALRAALRPLPPIAAQPQRPPPGSRLAAGHPQGASALTAARTMRPSRIGDTPTPKRSSTNGPKMQRCPKTPANGVPRHHSDWLPSWGIEPQTNALREHSDVSATRAVLDLTRPNALGVSRPLLGCSGGFADSMRTQLSDSSRIRVSGRRILAVGMPAASSEWECPVLDNASHDEGGGEPLHPGQNEARIDARPGAAPSRRRLRALASLASSSPPCWQLGPRPAVGVGGLRCTASTEPRLCGAHSVVMP
jgi:hypothetical protein